MFVIVTIENRVALQKSFDFSQITIAKNMSKLFEAIHVNTDFYQQ